MILWCLKNDIALPGRLRDYCHQMDREPAVIEAMTKEGLR
jgi:hypothetical protein